MDGREKERDKEWNKEWDKKRIILLLLSVIPAAACMVWWYRMGFSGMKIIRYAVLLYCLPWLAQVDRKERIVPGVILKWMLFIRLAILVAEILCYREVRVEIFLSALGGFCMGGGIMLLAYVISHKGVGAGDVKLIAVTGLYVGSSNIYAVLLLSFLLAAVYGVAGILLRKMKLKDEIAFVPFAAAACLIVMLIGM